MKTLDCIEQEIDTLVTRHLERDGVVPENDEAINSLSRELVRRLREQEGEAWLVRINEPDAPMTKQIGEPTNWCGEFVIPRYNAVIADLATRFSQSPTTTLFAQIEDAVRTVGGHQLYWS